MNHYLITSKNIFEQTRLLEFIEDYLEPNINNPYYSKVFKINIYTPVFIQLSIGPNFSTDITQFKENFPGIKIVQKIQKHNSTKYITL